MRVRSARDGVGIHPRSIRRGDLCGISTILRGKAPQIYWCEDGGGRVCAPVSPDRAHGAAAKTAFVIPMPFRVVQGAS